MRRGALRLQRPYAQIPGPPQWPVLGSLPDFIKRGPEIHRVHSAYYRMYGPIVKINLLGTQEVIVYDPREYLKVFQNEGPYPSGFVGDLWMVHAAQKGKPVKSFVTSVGKDWQERRRVVQKDIMSPAAAASYLAAINSTVDKISERIDVLSAADADGVVRFKDLAKFMAFDLFCSAALGRSLNTIDPAVADKRDLQFVDDSCGALDRTLKLFTKPHAKYVPTREYREMKAMYDALEQRGSELVREAAAEVRAKEAQGQSYGDDGPIVHRMLSRGVDEKVVTTELGGLLGGSVDTTQHVVLWLLVNLASHPEAQRRLAAELDSVLQGRNYSKDVQSQLPYLRATIRESHRRNHTNPLVTMRRLDADIVLAGYEVPAGTRISFNAADIQVDAAVVDDPDAFRPERFLAEEVQRRAGHEAHSVLDHKLLATPFGFGARMCIGARLAENEIWALMCRIFQDFELRLAPPDQRWDVRMPFMTIADPFPAMEVRRRRPRHAGGG